MSLEKHEMGWSLFTELRSETNDLQRPSVGVFLYIHPRVRMKTELECHAVGIILSRQTNEIEMCSVKTKTNRKPYSLYSFR